MKSLYVLSEKSFTPFADVQFGQNKHRCWMRWPSFYLIIDFQRWQISKLIQIPPSTLHNTSEHPFACKMHNLEATQNPWCFRFPFGSFQVQTHTHIHTSLTPIHTHIHTHALITYTHTHTHMHIHTHTQTRYTRRSCTLSHKRPHYLFLSLTSPTLICPHKPLFCG